MELIFVIIGFICIFTPLFVGVFLLFDINDTVQYFIKFTMINLLFGVYYQILNLLVKASPVFEKPSFLMFLHVSKFFSVLYGIQWFIEGKNNLDAESTFIVLNEQGSLDILGMLQIWPFRISDISFEVAIALQDALLGTNGPGRRKGELFKRRHIFATRIKNRDKIPPNGDESFPVYDVTKKFLQFAIDNNLKITPIVFSEYYFLDHTRNRFGEGKVIMKVLPTLCAKEFKNTNALNEKMLSQMNRTFYELNEHIRLII